VAVTQIQYYGTGRRKSAAARVFLRPGSGAIQINARPLNEALRVETLQGVVKVPLILTETADKFDVICTTSGGGISGQAGAIRLGIARALCAFDLELRPRLKKAGLLTRDPRIKERKKYGMAGARKRFQFSKR
jgi:small subunit ribosomal protein S9